MGKFWIVSSVVNSKVSGAIWTSHGLLFEKDNGNFWMRLDTIPAPRLVAGEEGRLAYEFQIMPPRERGEGEGEGEQGQPKKKWLDEQAARPAKPRWNGNKK